MEAHCQACLTTLHPKHGVPYYIIGLFSPIPSKLPKCRAPDVKELWPGKCSASAQPTLRACSGSNKNPVALADKVQLGPILQLMLTTAWPTLLDSLECMLRARVEVGHPVLELVVDYTAPPHGLSRTMPVAKVLSLKSAGLVPSVTVIHNGEIYDASLFYSYR